MRFFQEEAQVLNRISMDGINENFYEHEKTCLGKE